MGPRRLNAWLCVAALAAAPLRAHDTGGWGLLQAQLAAEGAFAPTPTPSPTAGPPPTPVAASPSGADRDSAAGPAADALGDGAGATDEATGTAAAAETASAGAESVYEADTVLVRGRAASLLGQADSAAEGKLSREDLAQRPLLRPGEALEAVPGLAVAQHSGDGKANQYFTRGFNLDHGTDFAFSVDGVPVNLPTHAHGQGYADLNFLIPELVQEIAYEKGSYNPGLGDFATAGAADFRYPRGLDRGLLQLDVGEWGYRRVLAASPFGLGGVRAYAAAEGVQNGGPWAVPEGYQKLNGLLHLDRGGEEDGLSAEASFSQGAWTATDQVPRRAVAEGLIPANGSLDLSDGGATEREGLQLAWRHQAGGQALWAQAYAFRSELQLFSDFTYFLDDPVHGDQFEQVDQRTVEGLRLRDGFGFRLLGAPTQAELGLDLRNDNVTALGLYHTQARRLLSTTQSGSALLTGLAGYAGARTFWTPWLRGELGFRWDQVRFAVADPDPSLAAEAWAGQPQPKLGLTAGPFGPVEAYADYGWGYHSNDARILSPASVAAARAADPGASLRPLARVRSAELGLRWARGGWAEATLSLWRMDLDSELTFNGDAAASSVGPASTRCGVELGQRLRWGRLFLDADYAYSLARFNSPDLADDPAHPGLWVPEAVEHMAGATLGLGGLGPLSLGLRLRYFGGRALTPDGSVRSPDATLLSAQAGLRLPGGQALSLELFNLLDRAGDGVAYDYASRLPGEPAGGVEDVHAHPAEPRELRVDYRLAF